MAWEDQIWLYKKENNNSNFDKRKIYFLVIEIYFIKYENKSLIL